MCFTVFLCPHVSVWGNMTNSCWWKIKGSLYFFYPEADKSEYAFSTHALSSFQTRGWKQRILRCLSRKMEVAWSPSHSLSGSRGLPPDPHWSVSWVRRKHCIDLMRFRASLKEQYPYKYKTLCCTVRPRKTVKDEHNLIKY